tara:strand:+ start:2812 stop:3120 length:309 start_codon:yes stop_codon:yes gene_type:complete
MPKFDKNKGFKVEPGYAPFKMGMKEYGKGKNPIQMSIAEAKQPMAPAAPMQMNSPAKGLFSKIGGAIKGAVAGKGVAGALVNPVGAIASGGKGLFMKEKYKK